MVITEGFTTDSIGKQFRVKVLASNIEGSTYSDIATIVLGDKPSAPENPVRKLTSSTSSLTVEYDELAVSSLNGLAVQSYSLEIDWDLSGNFYEI